MTWRDEFRVVSGGLIECKRCGRRIKKTGIGIGSHRRACPAALRILNKIEAEEQAYTEQSEVRS